MSELTPAKKAAIALLTEGEEYVALFFHKAKGFDIFSPLKEAGWFSPEKNPAPVEIKGKGHRIPHWPALQYLERIAIECTLPRNHAYAAELMQIIRDVTRPTSIQKVDNYHTWYSFAKIITLLPTDVITTDDVQLVADWLDSHFDTSLVGVEIGLKLLPRLLKGEDSHELEIAEKLTEVITRLGKADKESRVEGGLEELVSVIKPYWLKEILERNAKTLGAKCGRRVIDIFQNRLHEVMAAGDQDRWSFIWRSAIEDHEQIHTNDLDVKNILLIALRDSILRHSDKDWASAKGYVKELFYSNSQVLTRLALHVTNERFDIFKDLFWDALNSNFFNSHLKHEMYFLLEKHFNDFSEEQKTKITDIINGLVAEPLGEEDQAMENAYLRLEWLWALKGKTYRAADALIAKYQDITKLKPEHPDFSFFMGVVVEKSSNSPYSVEKILSYDIPELVTLLNDFKESGKWEEPDEEGLGEALKEAVKQKPSFFWNDLVAFLKVKFIYQLAIIRAYEDLWKSGSKIDWGRILTFCWNIVEPDAFWDGVAQSDIQGYKQARNRITSCISDLIRAGVETDQRAFEAEHFPLAERIILRILKKEPSVITGDKKDALTQAINTPRGHSIEALFSYSLRRCRLEDKESNNHNRFWESIRSTYDQELDLCEKSNYEFSTLCGFYLPNLMYISKEWVESNIDRIFSTKSEAHWLCAMQGYAYVSKVYGNIYALLKQYQHLSRVLSTVFDNEQVRTRIIEHISVAYLSGDEELEGIGSLFAEILGGWRKDDISHITWFFWTLRDKQDEKLRDRILKFWAWCSEKIGESQGDNSGLLSDLTLLSAFLKTLTGEQKSWLLKAAPYVQEKHHETFFLEYLDALSSDYPSEVGEVYLQIVKRYVFPEYRKENIRSIVEKLYKAEIKNIANEICDKYYSKGHEFLKDLYDKYN